VKKKLRVGVCVLIRLSSLLQFQICTAACKSRVSTRLFLFLRNLSFSTLLIPSVVHEPARVEPTYKLELARLVGDRGSQGSSFGDRLINWLEPVVNDTKNRLSLHQV
jgi:hypothetical protein